MVRLDKTSFGIINVEAGSTKAFMKLERIDRVNKAVVIACVQNHLAASAVPLLELCKFENITPSTLVIPAVNIGRQKHNIPFIYPPESS